jgi:hypothetical protein
VKTRRIIVQGQPDQRHETLSEKAGEMAQVVEHLPNKCETVSSNLQNRKKGERELSVWE